MTGTIRGALILVSVFLIAGCDTKANKTFEQSVKDRQAASAGDPYATLESSLPKQLSLTYRQPDQYQDYAAGQSGTFRSTYDSLLTTLDADKEVDLKGEPGRSCRAAYAAASRYQKDGGSNAAVAAAARDGALDALRECRAAAKKIGDKGKTLARFASTGIAMIGTKVVGQGDQKLGLEIWAEGEKAAGEDKPGFELGVKALRGY